MKKYVQGEDRFIHFAKDILGVELLELQKEILREVARNRRTVIIAGNGNGKTFTVAILELAFLYTHSEAMVLHTSRSNSHTRNTTYRELRELHETARERGFPFSGTVKKTPMEIDFEDSQTRKYEAVSPSNPDGLEGRHSDNFLAVVDEADKKEITDGVIESAESSLTDTRDKIVVIGNPPRNKGNSLYRLMESDNWNTLQYSSFDCDNVQIQLGNMDGDVVSGPITLENIKYDWEKYHGSEWPSYEDVMEQSARYVDDDGTYHFVNDGDYDENESFREDLAEAWYRRRCGIIPPKGAAEARPFYTSEVDEAVERYDFEDALRPSEYDAIGIDVAGRGEDETVITGVTRASQESTGRADVITTVSGDTETDIENGIRHTIRGVDETPIGFDSVGLGGPVADTFRNEGYNVVRFDGGSRAKNDSRYRNQRTEAWCEFGTWLHNGSIDADTELSNELFGVSEHIELNEKSLMSGTVWMATPKDELRKASKYGESPDYLDSVSIGVWTLNHNTAESDGGWNIYSLN